MANRFWVGGNDNWNATAGSKWATTSGGAGGAAVPTAADDVFFDNGTGHGNVTIPTATTVTARSINFVDGAGGAYVDTFTHASNTANINLGDGTAGASNVAIKYSAGMTLTLTGVGTINLISTSTTQQTITTNGKTVPSIVFNGAGSKYQFTDTYNSSGNLTHTNFDTLDYNSQAITCSTYTITGNANTRAITWGTSVVNATLFGGTAIAASAATNVTITASVGAQLNASNANNPGINLGSINWGNVAVSHTTASAVNGALVTSSGATIYSYTRTGSANKTDYVQFTGSLTVTNSFAFNGNSSTNRMLMTSNVPGTAFALTNNGSYSVSNVDFQDIAFSGSASTNFAAITGLSGDCGGNSGATFTTPATQTFDSTNGNWSTAARWTSRVPLPQDNVVVNGSSGNPTLDMPRIGADIDFNGFTGTATWTSGLAQTNYGSYRLASGMTLSMGNTVVFTMAGRGNHTFTSAGKAVNFTNGSIQFTGPGGTYTLQDAFSTNSSFNWNDGTIVTGSYSITCNTFLSNTTRARNMDSMGTTIVSITSTGAATVLTFSATNLTKTNDSESYTIANTSASTRTIANTGARLGTLNYVLAGSTGQMNFTATGYFKAINFSDATNARTAQINAAVTITVDDLSGFIGTSGKLMTLQSSSAGSPAYLEVINQPTATDYLSVKDIYGVIPNKLYVGINSTNVSGNTNVEFTATPATKYIRLRADIATTGTSAAVAFPYGLTPLSGRRMVLAALVNNTTAVLTPPTGFTQAMSPVSIGTAYKLWVWEKISDGTETSLTVNSDTSVSIFQVKLYTLGGFTGTATVDVTDSNSTASSVTSLASNGSNPSNTDNPALAIAFFGVGGSAGNSVSASNSFGVLRDGTELTQLRTVSKYLTSNAAVNTTYTWTTARTNNVAALLVYKDVIASTFTPKVSMFM